MARAYQELWHYEPTTAVRLVVARARAEAARRGVAPSPELLLLALLEVALLDTEALLAAGCALCEAQDVHDELAYVPWLLGEWGADLRGLYETCCQELGGISVRTGGRPEQGGAPRASESYRALLAFARTGVVEPSPQATFAQVVMPAQLSVATAFDDLLRYPTPLMQAAFVRYEELHPVVPWPAD